MLKVVRTQRVEGFPRKATKHGSASPSPHAYEYQRATSFKEDDPKATKRYCQERVADRQEIFHVDRCGSLAVV
jgi:hypothetical protein